MKTFILSIPNNLRLTNQSLDARAVLRDKTWVVFNDDGVKQVFIFQKKGKLIVSTNGVVTYATWEFIPANCSIVITTDGASIMYHPVFIDEVIFALQQDGTNSYLFMIDEANRVNFHPITLLDLNNYFAQKEQLLIAANRKRIEAERVKNEMIEKQRQEELERRRIEQQRAKEAKIKEEEIKRKKELLNMKKEQIRLQYKEDIERIIKECEKERKKQYYAALPLSLFCIFLLLLLLSRDSETIKIISTIGLIISLVCSYIIVAKYDKSEVSEIESFIDSKLMEEKAHDYNS